MRRKERAEDLFAATVEREKNKSSILDKTFKEALERAKADPSKPKGFSTTIEEAQAAEPASASELARHAERRVREPA